MLQSQRNWKMQSGIWLSPHYYLFNTQISQSLPQSFLFSYLFSSFFITSVIHKAELHIFIYGNTLTTYSRTPVVAMTGRPLGSLPRRLPGLLGNEPRLQSPHKNYYFDIKTKKYFLTNYTYFKHNYNFKFLYISNYNFPFIINQQTYSSKSFNISLLLSFS